MQETDTRRRFFALFSAVMLPMFLAAVDQTVLALATPAIADEFADRDGTSWLAVGYLLASVSMVPLYGRLADRFVPITWPAAVVGVATGVYSHLPLDGFLHGDTHLPWLGWASWARVEAACGVMGLVGGARLWRQKVIQEAWAELRRRSPWG